MMKAKLLGAAALGLMVAACGTNPTDRTTGGAAAGAATGAAVGALGGPVGALGGAAIGGGVGAVAGATTTPDQVNLGRPVWNDPEVRIPGTSNRSSSGMASRSGNTRQVQQALNQRGYDVGPVDGVMGPQTRRAISQYQRDNNMNVTGRADPQLASALGVSESSTARDTAATGRNSNISTGSDTGRSNTITGGGRPNPVAPSASPNAAGARSNSPVNDPVGGSGQAMTPGLNQNRDGGSNR